MKKDLEMEANDLYPVYQNSLVPLGYYAQYNCNSNTTYIISAGAAGDFGFSDKMFWAADDCLVCNCSNNINSKYLYYHLMNSQQYIKPQVRKASVPRLSKSVIGGMKINLPSLEEQEKIVNILDRFDRLINDISDGLPAEIKLRRKQYGYYRNKLLNFEEE